LHTYCTCRGLKFMFVAHTIKKLYRQYPETHGGWITLPSRLSTLEIITSNVFPVSYIEPCFLLSSPRFVFPISSSIPYTLSTTITSISLYLHLVLLAPVNSCESHNYYLVLSFWLMYSSSGLSTDVFPNKTNINKHIYMRDSNRK